MTARHGSRLGGARRSQAATRLGEASRSTVPRQAGSDRKLHMQGGAWYTIEDEARLPVAKAQ